jgi:hypothetical protein
MKDSTAGVSGTVLNLNGANDIASIRLEGQFETDTGLWSQTSSGVFSWEIGSSGRHNSRGGKGQDLSDAFHPAVPITLETVAGNIITLELALSIQPIRSPVTKNHSSSP